ncbi:hypothetical protein NQT74_04815 [Alteromonas stellipolaris]|uniref:hypothetical protein n=1 Tax=Alteromonas stellipolaris TaxID=233316 RepID=UPI002118476C|nr:hypothetical protein [Alteromonas stellipolaris]MCQ8847891.1 hypothetical protein [Alteromonas stellipolaris]
MSKESLWNLQERVFNFIFTTLNNFPEQEDKDGYLRALENYQEFQYDENSLARGIPLRFTHVSNADFKQHCEEVLVKLRNVYKFTLFDDEQLQNEGRGNGNTYNAERDAIVLVGDQIKAMGKNYLQGRKILDQANFQYVNFENIMWDMAQQCFTDHVCDAFGEESSYAWQNNTKPEAPYGKGKVAQIALSMLHFGKTGISGVLSSIPKEMRSFENPRPIEWHEAMSIINIFKEEASYLQWSFESNMLPVEAMSSLPLDILNTFDEIIGELSGARRSVRNMDQFIENACANMYRFQKEVKVVKTQPSLSPEI